MYGDSEVMRRRVDQLREQAVDIRMLADQLVARAESSAWHGRAADSMRLRIRERAIALRETAARHETAAESLEQHATEIDVRNDMIDSQERKAGALRAEARARLAAGHDSAPADRQLTAFVPPPSGHKDWLSVELPGLPTPWTGRP